METRPMISTPTSLATVASILVLAISLANATDSKCDAICGKVEEVKNAMELVMANQDKKEDKKKAKKETRIVNGYSPPPRPFMALLLNYENGYKDEEMDTYSTCGGSIINNRFVITAAHCVCIVDGPPQIPCTEENELKWDWENKLKVHIGLKPNDDIKNSDLRKNRKYDVKKIIVYPGWKGAKGMDEGDDGADLALVQLKKKLKWDTRLIQPICLPKAEELDVPDNKAYVAGWGKTELDDRAKGVDGANCMTDNRGPGRNKKCRFPFTFKSSLKDSAVDSGLEIYECEKGYFPSNENSKCQQFLNFQKNFDWNKTDHVVIRYNMKKDSTKCYSSKGFEEYGWCGVCIDGAQAGEEGYCHDDMSSGQALEGRSDDLSDETLAKEMTVTKPGKNWGYCTPECHKEYEDVEGAKKWLMETTQTVFSNKECNIMARLASDGGNKVTKNEVCAGLKFPFPKYKVYNRKFVKKVGDKNEYKFEFMEEKVNYLGYSKEIQKLGYYIGYSDSCEGDSGGPLFQFVDGKAVIRGIVSRGSYSKSGCAVSNAPGIYTNVHSWIKWVLKEAKSGSC